MIHLLSHKIFQKTLLVISLFVVMLSVCLFSMNGLPVWPVRDCDPHSYPPLRILKRAAALHIPLKPLLAIPSVCAGRSFIISFCYFINVLKNGEFIVLNIPLFYLVVFPPIFVNTLSMDSQSSILFPSGSIM